jgi:hypothetical protein
MLRLWRAGSHAGQQVWRASLENPHTGERLAFGDTKALFAFLAELTSSQATACYAPATEPLSTPATSSTAPAQGAPTPSLDETRALAE